jgi:MFS family permease
MAAVSGWFKENMGLATGITSSGVAVGGLLLPLVTHLIDGLGWRDAMFFMGIGIWLIPLPLALLLRPSPYAVGRSVIREKKPTLNARKSVSPAPRQMGARDALKSRLFWIIFLCFMCQFFPIGAAITHIMPFLSSVGVDRTTGSLIASILPTITVVGRIGFGRMGDRVGNKVVTTTAMALTALGALLASCIEGCNMLIIVPFLFAFGIGWGGSVPMLNGMLCDCFGSRNIASIYGFAGSAVMLGIVFGAPLAGWIYDKSGSYRIAWLLLAGITGTGTILFFKFVDSPAKDPVERPMPS